MVLCKRTGVRWFLQARGDVDASLTDRYYQFDRIFTVRQLLSYSTSRLFGPLSVHALGVWEAKLTNDTRR